MSKHSPAASETCSLVTKQFHSEGLTTQMQSPQFERKALQRCPLCNMVCDRKMEYICNIHQGLRFIALCPAW